MTCDEFQSQWGDHAATFPVDGEMPEHLRACANCRGVFEAQRELRRHLQSVRDSAPQIPDSLDARVLTKYREYVATATSRSEQSRRGMVPLILSWKGGVAAMALVLTIFAFVVKKSRLPATQHNSQTMSVATKVGSTLTPPTTATPAVETIKRQTKSARIRRTKPRVETLPAKTVEASLPAGFRSLMYCDVLSCPDAMEMIRVQLPPAFAGLASSSPSNEVVYADVLVGPDGIARGIRIVQ